MITSKEVEPYNITRNVTDDDISFLIANISKKDATECSFQCVPLASSLRDMFNESTEIIAIHRDGVLTNIGGVQGHDDNLATCWMLKTKQAQCKTREEKIRQRATLDKVLEMLKTETSYKTVVNRVWLEQSTDLKWLPTVGFEILTGYKIQKTNPDGKVGVFIPILYKVNREED